MTFGAYQRAAIGTATYEHAVTYPAMGLAGEAGEVANKVKKVLRGDRTIADARDAIGQEIGGVLWYCAALATDLGLRLEDIAAENLRILQDRAIRGVIKGDGDNR